MDIESLKEDVLKKYAALSLDDKRNEFNEEIIIINKMVSMIATGNGNVDFTQNYHKVVDLPETEDEFLSANYAGLMEIKNNLMTIIENMTK